MAASTNIIQRPETLALIRRYARPLYQHRELLISAIRRAAQELSPREAAFSLASQHGEIRLIGLLSQLPPNERTSVLTLDGGLDVQQAAEALEPVQQLEAIPHLVEALSWVLPTWFPASRRVYDETAITPALQMIMKGDIEGAHQFFQGIRDSIIITALGLYEFARTKIQLAEQLPADDPIRRQQLLRDAKSLLEQLLSTAAPRKIRGWAWKDLASTLQKLNASDESIQHAVSEAQRLAPDGPPPSSQERILQATQLFIEHSGNTSEDTGKSILSTEAPSKNPASSNKGGNQS